MPRSHDIIIQETLDFLRSHLSEPLDLAAISDQMHCSKSWLQKIFPRLTGKGPIAHLIELRVEKAKELLRNTRLGVSEIAVACGFNSHAYFGIAFRRATNLSPTEYRKQAGKTESGIDSFGAGAERAPRIWLSDSMEGDALAVRWQATQGDWIQETGYMCGTGEENVNLNLKRLLPDNFHLSLEFRLESFKGSRASLFGILLYDAAASTAFYEAKLHDFYGAECVVYRRGAPIQESTKSDIREGAWHKVDLALNDDTLVLSLNGEERIVYRDPFPAPYEKRCLLQFHTWQSRLSLRNVRIEDLGFLPFGRTIRQADALYNSGLFEQARQLYQRMLDTETNPADLAELHCKLSLCALSKNEFLRAREWAQKVPISPQSDLWAQQAALVLLEVDWREGDIQQMLKRISALAQKPQLRLGLNGIVQQAAQDFDNRGFFEEELLLRNSLFNTSDESTPGYLCNYSLVCESLLQLNRLESAATQLRKLADLGRAHPRINEYWLFALADALNRLGKTEGSAEIIREIQSRSHDSITRARCDVYEAFCLRSQGKFAEAVDLLRAVQINHPRAGNMSTFAKLTASSILVSLFKPDEALEVISEIDDSDTLLMKGYGSRYKYPPFLARGDYEKAAEQLLIDSNVESDRPALGAEQATKASLVLAMFGQFEECRKVLNEITRRYPETRVRYYAALAAALEQGIRVSDTPGWATGILPYFEKLPYPIHVRSEIFYLAGSLFLKQGEFVPGRALLRRSAEEDLTNAWPAVLAKKEDGQFLIKTHVLK